MVMNKDEIVDILKDSSRDEWLYSTADRLRKQYKGDTVHLRGLLEFSNICKCSCQYCGLRAQNSSIDRYRLTKEEILNYVSFAVEKLGYKTIVLQSGEDSYFDSDRMCEIIREIKKLKVALTLSIGEKTYEEYRAYKTAGADRYLLRIETTDENLYSRMHPGASFTNRLSCLEHLKQLGYETGSGILVGLPGQSLESIAADILYFKKMDFDMIGIGPFIPHPETPLKDSEPGSFELSLKVMALTRIMLPDINIPATTAMETLHPDGRMQALKSGANVVMPNITGVEFRKKYEIYPGKICTAEDPSCCRGCIEAKISSIGRQVSTGYGFRCE